jgi:hypothetical protein
VIHVKAADLYGAMGIGTPTTQENTNPAGQSQQQKEQANAAAQGKPIKNTYGVIAILSMVGILIGAKFALEKR